MGKFLRFAFLAGLILPTVALAEKEPIPGPADPRIRTITYNARDVVLLRGAYGYSMSVRFSDSEVVEDIGLGDSKAWQVVKSGDEHGILLKPQEDNANTNLQIRTSRRLYNFSLSAITVTSSSDKALTYSVFFNYPQDELEAQAASQKHRDQEISAAAGPESYNWSYSWSGSASPKPLRVFDDGKFTYFEFAETTKLPAIFSVDADGNEALVNWHQKGRFVVVERIESQYSLRDGSFVTCIFNDTIKRESRKANYRKRKPL
jgi:type IV secretion system protein VirB9